MRTYNMSSLREQRLNRVLRHVLVLRDKEGLLAIKLWDSTTSWRQGFFAYTLESQPSNRQFNIKKIAKIFHRQYDIWDTTKVGALHDVLNSVVTCRNNLHSYPSCPQDWGQTKTMSCYSWRACFVCGILTCTLPHPHYTNNINIHTPNNSIL